DELDDQSAITALMKEAYASRFITMALQAADSNAAHENYSGIPLVLDALDNDDITMYMSPPEPVSEYAAAILRQVSGEDYGFSASAAPNAKSQAVAKWRAWWEVFRGVNDL
ncbi:MAG: hypothetical protein U9Q07_14335, partial [Planctomycetota bacterium]|nr:hypothetical protein [Planctomycetota bacterium]